MKKIVSLSFLLFLLVSISFAQSPEPTRGPFNIQDNGVIDGVVVKDEVPVRSKVEYEYVRSADLVWSKRVFSRIDKREKLNHELFFPLDFINDEKTGTYNWMGPTSPEDVDSQDWIRHPDRYSLWTIIMKHIMLGDLTIYEVSDSDREFKVEEDGYKFKYPVRPSTPGSSVKGKYFSDSKYKRKAQKFLTAGKAGDPLSFEPDGQSFKVLRPNDASVTADEYLQGLLDTGAADYGFVGNDFLNDVENYTTQPKQLEKFRRWFDEASPGDYILQDPKEKWITSSSITAYNLKEDWYFDKERSILDRRIIAIAPVTRYKAKEWNENIKENRRFNRYSNMIFENERLTPDGVETGVLIDAEYKPYPDPVVEAEMFWLYFPELRNVLINYYVYNDQNDAQWMTFDDLFWKRRFTSKIFRVSDKFDREIQDYKFGVDALYEAERLKEEIRNWEINVWNY